MYQASLEIFSSLKQESSAMSAVRSPLMRRALRRNKSRRSPESVKSSKTVIVEEDDVWVSDERASGDDAACCSPVSDVTKYVLAASLICTTRSRPQSSIVISFP